MRFLFLFPIAKIKNDGVCLSLFFQAIWPRQLHFRVRHFPSALPVTQNCKFML